MAAHNLPDHFAYFLKRLSPRPDFEERAASEQATITSLIEDPTGPCRALSPICFLQGSYGQHTAMESTNDVNIVALCRLWYPGRHDSPWTRDRIFQIIAQPLLDDARYRDRVRFRAGSTCIKVDMDIAVEILPAVYRLGNRDPGKEPHYIYRGGTWRESYARQHQRLLSEKDAVTGNFVSMTKILKHLRSQSGIDVTSFHIESLLYSLPDELFVGAPASYVTAVLDCIASFPAAIWAMQRIKTPCRDKFLFGSSEWNTQSWERFHKAVGAWALDAREASESPDREQAIRAWQAILGNEYFPADVGA